MRSITKLGLAAAFAACGSLGMSVDHYWVADYSGSWLNASLWNTGIAPSGDAAAYIGYNSPGFNFSNPLAITVNHNVASTLTIRDLYLKTNFAGRNINITGTMSMGPSTAFSRPLNDGLHTINHLAMGTSTSYTTASPVSLGSVTLSQNARILVSGSSSTTNLQARSIDLGTNGSISTPRLILKSNASVTGNGTINAAALDLRGSGMVNVGTMFRMSDVKIQADGRHDFAKRITGASTITGGDTKLLDGFSGTLTLDGGIHQHYGTSSGQYILKNGARLDNRGELTLNTETTQPIANYGTLIYAAGSSTTGLTQNFGEIRTIGNTTTFLTTRGDKVGYLNVQDTSTLYVTIKDTSAKLSSFKSAFVAAGARLAIRANNGSSGGFFSNTGLDFNFNSLGPGTIIMSQGIVGGTILGMSKVRLAGSPIYDGVRMPGTQALEVDSANYGSMSPILNNHKSETGDFLTINNAYNSTIRNSTLSGKLVVRSSYTNLNNVVVKKTGDLLLSGVNTLSNVENHGIINFLLGYSGRANLTSVTNHGNITVSAEQGPGTQFNLTNYGNLLVRPYNASYVSFSPSVGAFRNFGTARFDDAFASNIINRGQIFLEDSDITFNDASDVGIVTALNSSKVFLPAKGLEVERQITTDSTSSVFAKASFSNQALSTAELANRRRYLYQSNFSNVRFTDSKVRNILSGEIENSTFDGVIEQDLGEQRTLLFKNSPVPNGSSFTNTWVEFFDQRSVPKSFKIGGINSRVSKGYRSEPGTLQLHNIENTGSLYVGSEVEFHGTVFGRTIGSTVPHLSVEQGINFGSLIDGGLSFRRGENRGLIQSRQTMRLGDTWAGDEFRNYGTVSAGALYANRFTNFGSIKGHADLTDNSYLEFSGTNRGTIISNFGWLGGNNSGTITLKSNAMRTISFNYAVNEASGSMVLEGVFDYGSLTNHGSVAILAKEGAEDLRINNLGTLSIATVGAVRADITTYGLIRFRRNAAGTLPIFRPPSYSTTGWGGNLVIEGAFAQGFSHEFYLGAADTNFNHSLNVLTPGWSVIRGGNSLVLRYLVPEPSSSIAVLAGAFLLLRRRSK